MISSHFTRLFAAATASGLLALIPVIAHSQSTYASPAASASASPAPCGDTNMNRTSTGNQPIQSAGSSSNSPSGPAAGSQPGSLTAGEMNCASPAPAGKGKKGKAAAQPSPSATPTTRP